MNLQEWWQWWAISKSWGRWRWPEMIECWLKGFVQKWGRLVPIYGQNALNPWKFCYPTFGQACAYLGASKICAFSLLIYMQAKHVVTYLLDHGEGAPHIFSLLLRQHWRAMAAESHGCGNPWIRPQNQPLSRPCAPLQKRQRPRDDFLWCVSLHSWNGANPRSSQTNKIITELVVWNIFFPYIGNSHPNWLSYFSEG